MIAPAVVLALAAAGQSAKPVLQPTQLPLPVQDPLNIDSTEDPILNLARGSVSVAEFLALVQQAVERHPQVEESIAGISEAEAAHDEAKAGRSPRVDLAINAQRSISRGFGDGDQDDFLERSRPTGRTDATLTVEQTLFDFGANAARVTAAGGRLRAASLRAEEAADRTALRAIAAWYDVFAYRALVLLGLAFSDSQQDLRSGVQARIDQGVSAPGDLPRVESYIASSQADLAKSRRLLANAEARFEELFGAPPPPDLGRAPSPGGQSISKEMAQFLARAVPEVRGAEALARAARQDAKAERAQALPNVTAGVDAGKFGLDDKDYDIRGRITVRQRFFGGVGDRVDQAEARAVGANARASRVRVESEREAAIAWSDVKALEQQLSALESSYLASRQSRDVLAERFRVARGTLFDLLEAESGYFNVATGYIRAITELDAARYVLLSRTGRLLETLNIEPPALEER